MLGEFWDFVCSVIHFWAEWSTGGILVLAIALARLLKSRDFRNKTSAVFLLFFLLLGFFSAWEDQKQNRVKAEMKRDFFKGLSEYNQKRIDTLLDGLQKNSKSVENKITDSPNSINTIGQSGGVNTINNGPKPYITSRTLVSLNVPSGTNFVTTFNIAIANSPDSPSLSLNLKGGAKVVSATDRYAFISDMYQVLGDGRIIKDQRTYICQFITDKQITDADVEIFLAPN
jgi:hypothetical protein